LTFYIDVLYPNSCQSFDLVGLKRNCPSVQGDPEFVGLRGQRYQVHGIDGAVYNLISDSLSQVNSRFIYINEKGDCPIIPSTGKRVSLAGLIPVVTSLISPSRLTSMIVFTLLVGKPMKDSLWFRSMVSQCR